MLQLSLIEKTKRSHDKKTKSTDFYNNTTTSTTTTTNNNNNNNDITNQPCNNTKYHNTVSIFSFLKISSSTQIIVIIFLLFITKTTTTAAKTTTTTTTTSETESNDDGSFFLLCLTDGSIYSVSAWTGEFSSYIPTDPLLQSHYAAATTTTTNGGDNNNNNDNNDDNNNHDKQMMMIVPGLDGKLYWQEEETSLLQELPLTISSLMENPVRSCNPNNENNGNDNCGILTAEAITSLIAIDPNGGKLVWKSKNNNENDNNNNNNKNTNNNNNPLLLLQRKDYWIQHVLAQTGQQSWNVSLGTYQALDFGSTSGNDNNNPNVKNKEKHNMIDDDGIEDEVVNEETLLPSIIFSNHGKTLSAISSNNDHSVATLLWRQTVPSTLSAVFGIVHGQWQPVQVLTATTTNTMDHHNEQQQQSSSKTTNNAAIPATAGDEERKTSSNHGYYEQWLWAQFQQQHQTNNNELDAALFPRAKALPSPTTTPISPKNNEDENENFMSFCRNNYNARDYAGICPNFKRTLLQLPAPPVIEPSTGIIFFHIHLIVILLLLVIIILLAILWHLRKQHELIHNNNQKVKSATTTTTTNNNNTSRTIMLSSSSMRSENSERLNKIIPPVIAAERMLRRSTSMPISLTISTTNTDNYDGAPPPPKSITNLMMVTSNNDNNNSSSSSKGDTDNNNNGQTTNKKEANNDDQNNNNNKPLLLQQPIQHYSRYALEFKELHAMGKGGFGSVFSCQNNLDGRCYAIKKILVNYDDLQRVLREVKILAVLDHPNIVRYYTAWLEEVIHDNNNENSSSVENNDNTMSKRYSSSILFSKNDPSYSTNNNLDDSVSSWGIPSSSKGWQQHNNDNLTGGWNNNYNNRDISFARRGRGLNNYDDDDYILFEDSNEEDNNNNNNSKSNNNNIAAESSSASNSVISSQQEEDTTLESQHQQSLRRRRSLSCGAKTLEEEEKSHNNRPSSFPTTTTTTKKEQKNNEKQQHHRHILYIQMQLCSQNTIAEFLADANARKGVRNNDSHDDDNTSTTAGGSNIDIRKALHLFVQVAEAVQHVHSRGLIHRDLKPQNCFLENDDNMTVKVGDFGLSRHSSGGNTNDDNTNDDYENNDKNVNHDVRYDDHTAGVGTRSYASPEQMRGSDYDSSTDVYSLGIMLFEMLYPMYTGMERMICLTKLRDEKIFPSDWDKFSGTMYPTLKDLIIQMTSQCPANRPSAGDVAKHIQTLLQTEFTILDDKHPYDPGTVLLRVEAEHREDVLLETMKLIRQEDDDNDEETKTTKTKTKIMQYGMRSSVDNKHIMEFALQTSKENANIIVEKLMKRPEIYKARQVSVTTSTTNSTLTTTIE